MKPINAEPENYMGWGAERGRKGVGANGDEARLLDWLPTVPAEIVRLCLPTLMSER
jgi:hypothetical protein